MNGVLPDRGSEFLAQCSFGCLGGIGGAHEVAPFGIVRYDQPVDAYREKIVRLCPVLGLDASTPPDFREVDLTHFEADGPAPARARECWERLNDLAL